MRMNIKKSIKLTAIIGGGVIFAGGIILGIAGLWPIAAVGYEPITYAAFRDNFIMADHYYRSNVKIAGEDEAIVDARETQRELQQATLEGMIEQILIEKELEQRYNKEDLDRLIDNKIGGIDLGSKEIVRGIELQYGMTPEEFKELRLLPTAKRELLEGSLTLENGTMENWINAKKKEIKVSVFVPALYWSGEHVRLK